MKKVLVTGANGYIGAHVVKKLCDKGFCVIAADFKFDAIDKRAISCKVPLFSGDKDIYEQLGKPDICIHLAWRDGFVHNSDKHMGDLSDHITFLQNLINGGLPMLSVMGTMHEIGYWEGAVDENTPCNPMSQYGIAKNALRQSLILFVKDKNCILHWLRAYYITGDDLKANNIFSKITKAAKEKKKEFPFTTGKNKYDFIDIEDLAEMIVAASVQDKVNGIINVCSGQPVSLADKVESFIKQHGYDIKLNYGVYPERSYDSPAIWGNAEKINEILMK